MGKKLPPLFSTRIISISPQKVSDTPLMIKLISLFLTLFLCFQIYARPKKVQIEVQGIPHSLSCTKEPSIKGFFCLSQNKYLVVSSFADTYRSFGKLSEHAEEQNFKITKIKDTSGKILYQSDSSGLKKSFTYDLNISSPKSLKEEYGTLLSHEDLLISAKPHGEHFAKESEKFEHFLYQKLEEINKRKKYIQRTFHSKKLTVSLENGKKISCKRGSSRKKNKADRKIEKIMGTPLVCGIFNCGKDKKGNKRQLFFHNDPNFAQGHMVYIRKNKFPNGPKISSITARGHSKPLVLYDHSHSNQNMFPGVTNFELTQKSFVPKALKDQSDFFKNWSKKNQQTLMKNTGRLCHRRSWKDFNRALKNYKKTIQDVKLIQYITSINNILLGYYLPLENIPSNACQREGVFYKPQTHEKTNLFSPSLEKRTISLERANELFQEAKSMKNIAWSYKKDGCYARAHLMAKRFKEMGVQVDKAWLKGEIEFKQRNGDSILWNFHVAPLIYVEDSKGRIEKYIIDPSTFDRPVKLNEWSKKLTHTKNIKIVKFPFPKNAPMFERNSLSFSNSSAYLPNDRLSLPEEEKLERAMKTMEIYSEYENE